METIDFYPKRFTEIPEQDNPAFGDAECLIVVKNAVGHTTVLHILPNLKKITLPTLPPFGDTNMPCNSAAIL